MPNNCHFSMVAKGKPKDLKNFLKYFIYEQEEGKKKGKYFARTFLDSYKTYSYFIKEHKKEISRGEVCIVGWCAWSVTSCMISGYPQKEGNENCITIMEACKKNKINVKIDSAESGMGFEEHITCDEEGDLTEETNDMPQFECKKCKSTQTESTDTDLNDLECCNCGSTGKWKAL